MTIHTNYSTSSPRVLLDYFESAIKMRMGENNIHTQTKIMTRTISILCIVYVLAEQQYRQPNNAYTGNPEHFFFFFPLFYFHSILPNIHYDCSYSVALALCHQPVRRIYLHLWSCNSIHTHCSGCERVRVRSATPALNFSRRINMLLSCCHQLTRPQSEEYRWL